MLAATLRAATGFRSGKHPIVVLSPKLPAKRFQLHYPDRTRAHISVPERDELLVAAKIRKINEFSYEYVEQTAIYHSFADIAPLRRKLFQPSEQTGYLEGAWIFERDGKRRRESEARVGEMVCQLRLRGALA